jgi:hypothetical protein
VPSEGGGGRRLVCCEGEKEKYGAVRGIHTPPHVTKRLALVWWEKIRLKNHLTLILGPKFNRAISAGKEFSKFSWKRLQKPCISDLAQTNKKLKERLKTLVFSSKEPIARALDCNIKDRTVERFSHLAFIF